MVGIQGKRRPQYVATQTHDASYQVTITDNGGERQVFHRYTLEEVLALVDDMSNADSMNGGKADVYFGQVLIAHFDIHV